MSTSADWVSSGAGWVNISSTGSLIQRTHCQTCEVKLATNATRNFCSDDCETAYKVASRLGGVEQPAYTEYGVGFSVSTSFSLNVSTSMSWGSTQALVVGHSKGNYLSTRGFGTY